MILKVSYDSSPVKYECLFWQWNWVNFGLQLFKIGEGLFSCFKQGKYLSRRADDYSHSQHEYNTRARNTQLLFNCGTTTDQHHFVWFAFVVEF